MNILQINFHLFQNTMRKGSKCEKSENGFWQYKCCHGRCNSCKNLPFEKLTCKNPGGLINYYIYEVTKTL